MEFDNAYEQSEFESACAAVEVQDPAGSRLRIPERLIQSLWYDQYVRRDLLATEDGRRVTVVSPGAWSLSGGPDFRHARIRIGNELLTGDVEIHLHSSDWHRHGHTAEPAFAGVILHVVYEHDAVRPCLSAFRREEIPTLVMARYLPADIAHLARIVDVRGYPGEGVGGIGACCRHLREEPGAFPAALRVVEEAGEARFARLTRRYGRQLDSTEPEELLYRGLLEGLGFRRNRVAFTELARRVPWERLRATILDASYPQRVLRIQANLFGMAGVLGNGAHDTDADTRAYRRELAAAWKQAELSPAEDPMPPSLWRLRLVRPYNHPLRRLGGVAHLFAEHARSGLLPDLVERLQVRENRMAAIDGFFEPQPSIYWSHRAGFGRPVFSEPVRPIGLGVARTIALNILLPFAAALGYRRREPSLARAARETFRAFPPLEENSVTAHVQHRMTGSRRERQRREWRRALVASARRQQGLHQLYRDRCARGPEGCEDCPVVGGMRDLDPSPPDS
jgi:hypothetical protein